MLNSKAGFRPPLKTRIREKSHAQAAFDPHGRNRSRSRRVCGLRERAGCEKYPNNWKGCGTAVVRPAPGIRRTARPRTTGAANARISGDLRGKPCQVGRRNRLRSEVHLRACRHAARHDHVRTHGTRDQAEGHLHADRVDEPDAPRLYRRARLAEGGRPKPFDGYSIGSGSIPTTTDATTRWRSRPAREGPAPIASRPAFRSTKTGAPIIKERIYLDKADPNILRNEITTNDHALTRPWTVSRFYKREHNPQWEEYNCTEDNRWVVIGGQTYLPTWRAI